jgi:hypothetical protein
MRRLVSLYASTLACFLGCNVAGTAEHVVSSAERDRASVERLYYEGIPLLRVPAPDDPLPYEEIIWPWEMGLGYWGWQQARVHAHSRMIRSSTPPQVSFYTEYGPGHRFDPERDKARVIVVSRLKDVAVLDSLKYFPEVRELRISTTVPVDDALSVLHYCPHLTRLEVWSAQRRGGQIHGAISAESMKGIGSLQSLRFLRLVQLEIDDEDLKHLEGMENLLYLELTNAHVTSAAFQTLATWPRIRWLKLYGLDFNQPIDDPTANALESLVGRVELLWMNPDDTDDLPTHIHESLEAPFRKIRANAHLARQPKP